MRYMLTRLAICTLFGATQWGCGGDEVTTGGAADASTVGGADVGAAGKDGAATPGNKPCVTSADCLPVVEPCRAASCQPNVGCVTVILSDGAICEDGDACTVSGLCKQGACTAGAPVSCNDGDACTADGCDPKVGCLHAPAVDGTACSDGNPCTADDVCKAAKCAPGANICGCKSDDDCAAKEDGNACNGTLFCDKSDAQSPKCAVNPASVVHCPGSFDTACLKNACQPKDGSCIPTPVESTKQLCAGSTCDWVAKSAGDPVGTFFVCDDGDPCTTVDHCQSGQCMAGTNNLCGCKSDAECVGQDDGNLCNGTLFCNKTLSPASCVLNPATVVACPSVDDTTCAKNECNPKLGTCAMVAQAEGKTCDDGNACTTGEACQKGACVATANTCTCKADSDCTAKDDGDLCNGTMFCDKPTGTCKINPATVVVCASVDDTTCQQNTCQPKTGQCAMVAVADGKACDDQNPCTANEKCDKGQCAATANTCSCKADSDCAAKEDGNLCNGTLFCKAGSCELNPATVVTCTTSFDTKCQQNQCNPKLGVCAMQPTNQGIACDDGNPCTKGEACHLGACSSDNNVCECQSNADCAAKDDGNFCNGTMFCDKSSAPYVCAVNTAAVVVCKSVDDTFCVASQCQPKTGLCEMTAVHQGMGCSDNNACTYSDMCKNGACQGTMADCKDDVACTADVCDAVLGCTNKADPAKCDDDNPCTIDACNAVAGCTHKLVVGACDDGNPCTSGDLCDGIACTGKPINCDDKDPCTTDVCSAPTGCKHMENTAQCDTGQPCTPLGVCAAGKCQPAPAPLFSKLVDGKAEDRVAAVLPGDLGAVTVVGATTSQGKGLHDVWLVRVDAGGAVLGQTAIGSAADEQVWGATAMGDGGLAVGSVSPGPGGGSDGYLVRFGSDMQAQWKQVGGGAGDEALRAAAAFGDGESVAVGQRSKAPGSVWWMVRVSAVGTVLWDKELGPSGVARAVAARGPDDYLVAGDVAQADGTTRIAVVQVDGLGTVKWQKSLDTFVGGALAVAVGPGGDAMVGGWQGKDFEDARLVRIAADGSKVLLDQLYGGAGMGVFTALQARTGGVLAFVGRRGSDAGEQLWLGRIDVAGKLLWDRSVGAALSGEPVALAVLPDEAHLVAATWQASDTQDKAARIVRSDPWGFVTCTDAGDCAGKKASECDDKNPCTHDLCQAALGCTHLVNALPCDDGNACTDNDTCDQGKCAKSSSGSCDDKNPCTSDVCDAGGGCTHSPQGGPCDDGNACTKPDLCTLGLCKPGAVDTCDDGNACSDDGCEAKKGCAHTLNTLPCQSGNCTYGDVCDGGFCKSSDKPAFLDKWYGSAVNDRASAVEQVGQDGFVVGGYAYPIAHPDGMVTRIGAQGEKLWESAVAYAPGTGDDYVRAVVPTTFGFIAAGHTNACSQRGLIARLDPAGKVAWVKARSPSIAIDNDCWDGHERGAFLAMTDGKDGSFTAVGWRTHANWSDTKVWLQRFDQDGAILNNQSYFNTASSVSVAQSVERASGGGYILAGYSTINSAGGYDGMILRADAAGAYQWWQRVGGKGNDYFYDAVPAPDGGFIAVGSTASSGAGLEDGWIVRFSQTGTPLWEKTLGGEAADIWYSARVLAGGNVVLGGATQSLGSGGQDAWLALVDPLANLQWQTVWGGPDDDIWNDVKVLKSGGFALVGTGVQPKQTQQDVRLVLTDAFGHPSCAASGGCFSKVSADCDDANPCTSDWCDKDAGCQHKDAAWPCSDDDACTTAETCKAGKCVGTAAACDDGNPCTSNTCDAKVGCVVTKLADGTACPGDKKCLAGVCK